MPDQLRRRAVEDALDQEAARPRDRPTISVKSVSPEANLWFDRPPLRQGLQVGPPGQNGIGPLSAPPRHQPVDEAPVIFDAGEVAAAAPDQRLPDCRLEVPVPGFHRPVRVGLTAIVAADIHAVGADEGVMAPGDVVALIGGQVAEE